MLSWLWLSNTGLSPQVLIWGEGCLVEPKQNQNQLHPLISSFSQWGGFSLFIIRSNIAYGIFKPKFYNQMDSVMHCSFQWIPFKQKFCGSVYCFICRFIHPPLRKRFNCVFSFWRYSQSIRRFACPSVCLPACLTVPISFNFKYWRKISIRMRNGVNKTKV